MTSPLPTERQRTAVRRMMALIADRSSAEVAIKQTFGEATKSADAELSEKLAQYESRFEHDRREQEQQFRAESKRLKKEYQSEHENLQREFKSSLASISERAEANEVAAQKALQEAVWLAETVYEATETQPLEQFQQVRKDVDGKLEETRLIREKAAALLRRVQQRKLVDQANRQIEPGLVERNEAPERAGDAPATSQASPVDAAAAHVEAQQRLTDALNEAQRHLDRMAARFIPRLFVGLWPIAFGIVLAFIGGSIAAWLRGMNDPPRLAIGAGIGVAAAAIILAALYFVARAQLRSSYRPMLLAGERAQTAGAAWLALAEQQRDAQRAALVHQRDRDVNAAKQRYEPVLEEIRQRREHHLARLNEEYPAQMKTLKEHFEEILRNTQVQHAQRSAELREQHDRDVRAARERHESITREARTRYESDWADLERRWHDGMAEVYAAVKDVSALSAEHFHAWTDPSWKDWSPPREFTPFIRFGQLHVDLAKIPGGIPADERLMLPGPASFDLPAMLAFPEPCSLLLQAGEHGRDAAVATLQTVMFRLLSTLPPGKVRFTIIDPVGLGQNFAGFMHLADYEGAFVADRIWTEDRHIDQRLLDLTEHMETVIQKYLRNEYETISEYNVDAGEIAEPFRFLVIANFPVNFGETAARRLASIAASGARCGVYTLVSVDTRQQLPAGFQLADLERHSATIVFTGNGEQAMGAGKANDALITSPPIAHSPLPIACRLKDDDYSRFPLTLDDPPSEAFLTEKLHVIGQAAKDSTRVEVPFGTIAPTDDKLWSRDTTSDVKVALGRAGATKHQHLDIGKGTSQHALIAGKTGSGKSTLMHVLITNLALWYSPEEVEFYLIDFKKGVEFKTYATHNLPHARAVAIESDREFGLSVLQRLDAELKHRGNLFRDLNVQDLASYRKAAGKKLPRTLLIIDEFQELFTEDDKIAQDAALLLDRLVRQGRAFGMHVILGSQTLGGAYSLARSTMGQMGVRIALQCNEADSYLILSDDNAAARLLARPGEAIYNDASGLVEGNNPFQISWLPDETRDHHLDRVTKLAAQRRFTRAEPQIVFEGNVPGDIARNHLLRELLEAPTWPAPSPTAVANAWLGEAIAIKDPTSAAFRRQSGNNLIILGQREEAALAITATSLISLAAQHSPEFGKFYILDGSPPDSPQAGYLERLAKKLPHPIQVIAYREVPGAINEISQELDRRIQDSAHDDHATYLMIYGLQRFRMLRQEEDFGLSSYSGDGDAPPRPEKQFGTILREGPVHGIHTLAWCDTANNLSRSLDRQGLKEFEIRVLFQMGAADSSNLIDSPLASRLGFHRALFFSEEQGQLEKFRPYALPDEGGPFIAEVGKQLSSRASTAKPKPVQSNRG